MSQQGDNKSELLLDNVAKAKRHQVTAACQGCRRKKVKASIMITLLHSLLLLTTVSHSATADVHAATAADAVYNVSTPLKRMKRPNKP